MYTDICMCDWACEALNVWDFLYLLELRAGVDDLTNNSNILTFFLFVIKGICPVLPIGDYDFRDLRAWSDLHFPLLLLYIVEFSLWRCNK